MKDNNTIVWGIIGCGDVTEKKSGPAFSKVEGSHLLAVKRRNASLAEDYARRHQIANWYANVDEMLGNSALNAIYIATPPSSHLDYALLALNLGKHVYVEKPVTLNAQEAVLLLQATKKSQGKLVVAHYRRQLPMFLKIKEWLDSGKIGAVQTVQLRLWQSRNPELVSKEADNWRTDPKISGGGYFFDLAPHQLDLMLYFFGPAIFYEGFSLIHDARNTVADYTSGTILFGNQVVFQGSWWFNAPANDHMDSCEILGNLGKIRFSLFGDSVYVRSNGQEEEIVFDHPEHIQYPMIASTVEFFRGNRPNPASIEEAVELMKIMDCFSKIR